MIAFKLTTCNCYTDSCNSSSFKLPGIFDFNFLSIKFTFPDHDIQVLLSFEVFRLLNIFKRHSPLPLPFLPLKWQKLVHIRINYLVPNWLFPKTMSLIGNTELLDLCDIWPIWCLRQCLITFNWFLLKSSLKSLTSPLTTLIELTNFPHVILNFKYSLIH